MNESNIINYNCPDCIDIKKQCSDCERTEFVNKIYTDTCRPQLFNNFPTPIACEYCTNNPKNGGSGICNCTLGTIEATC